MPTRVNHTRLSQARACQGGSCCRQCGFVCHRHYLVSPAYAVRNARLEQERAFDAGARTMVTPERNNPWMIQDVIDPVTPRNWTDWGVEPLTLDPGEVATGRYTWTDAPAQPLQHMALPARQNNNLDTTFDGTRPRNNGFTIGTIGGPIAAGDALVTDDQIMRALQPPPDDNVPF